MKQLVFFLLIIIKSTLFAQYSDGFSVGWRIGYCYGQGICSAPNSPNSPTPLLGENLNDYQAGYNRGFQMGSDAQRLDNNRNNSSSNRDYWQVVPPAKYQAPISDELLIAGAQYKAEQQRLYNIELQNRDDAITKIWDDVTKLRIKIQSCNQTRGDEIWSKIGDFVLYRKSLMDNNYYNSVYKWFSDWKTILLRDNNTYCQ
jgi:hypothetical protein